MKRYEKMTKAELVKLINYDVDCEICPLHTKGENCKPNGIDCGAAINDYLDEEISPRIAKINTWEELEKAYKDFEKYCGDNGCDDCKYYDGKTKITSCFLYYLLEEE